MNQGGELEDLDLLRAVGPIVAPTNNYVTTGERVSVVAEIAALEFKFDVHALPALGTYLPLGLAVWESGLNGFDNVAEFFGNQPKEKHDALFVDRFVAQATEVDGVAVGWAIFQRRVACFARHDWGRWLSRGASTIGRSMLRPYSFLRGIWYGVWQGVWHGLWYGKRQKRHDIRPFQLALRKIAKNLWKCGPRAESPFDSARVVFSLAPVCATRRYGAVPADDGGPILQQFVVLQPDVQRMWVQSGGPNGSTPTREEL